MKINMYLVSRFLLGLALIFTFPLLQAQHTALTFDGDFGRHRVTIPYHTAYDLGFADYTMEAIVRIKATRSVELPVPIFSTRTGPDNGYLFYMFSDKLLVQIAGIPNVLLKFQNTTYNYFDDQCHHVAMTRTGEEVKFYLDGTLQGTVLGGGRFLSGNTLYIGYDALDQISFEGALSEARFWNVVRTGTEINTYKDANVLSNTTGLIGLWKFTETSGQTVIDSSPTQNHGVLGLESSVENDKDPVRSNSCGFPGIVTTLFDSAPDAENITVVPNPFQTGTKVTLHKAAGNYSAEVYSMEGRLLHAEEIKGNNEFQLGEELQPGLYVLKVSSAEGITTTRLVKK